MEPLLRLQAGYLVVQVQVMERTILPDLGGRSYIVTPAHSHMAHADSALLPEGVETKEEFWDHVYRQLVYLLADQRVWVSRFASLLRNQ